MPSHQFILVALDIIIVWAWSSVKVLQFLSFCVPPVTWELCQGWAALAQGQPPLLYQTALPLQVLPPPGLALKAGLNSHLTVPLPRLDKSPFSYLVLKVIPLSVPSSSLRRSSIMSSEFQFLQDSKSPCLQRTSICFCSLSQGHTKDEGRASESRQRANL